MSTVFFYNNTDDYNSSCIYWGDAVIHNITRNATLSCIGYWSGTTGGTGAYTVINGLNFTTVPSNWTTSDVYFLSSTWYVDPPSAIYNIYGYRNLFAGDTYIFAKGKSFQVQIHPVEYTSGPHIDFQVFGTDFTATRYSINNSASTDTNVLAKSYYMYLYACGMNSTTKFYCETMSVNKTFEVTSTSSNSDYVLRYFPCGHNGHCTITNNSSVTGYQYFANLTVSTYMTQTPITIAAGSSYKNTNTIPNMSNISGKVYFILSRGQIMYALKYGFYEGYTPNQTFSTPFYYIINNISGSITKAASGTYYYTTYWVPTGFSIIPTNKKYFGIFGQIYNSTTFDELTSKYCLAQPFLTDSEQNWNAVPNRILSPASIASTNDYAYMYNSCTGDIPGVDYNGGTNTFIYGTTTHLIVVPCFILCNETPTEFHDILTVKTFNWTVPHDENEYYIPTSESKTTMTLSNSHTTNGLNVHVRMYNSSTGEYWDKYILVSPSSTTTVDLSDVKLGAEVRIADVKYAYNTYIHDDNKWRSATAYVYIDGTWKIAKPYIHNGTTWKEIKEFV